MWSLSTLTSTLQSAAETASASLKKAADDLTKEYEATTARPAETVLPVMTHEAQPLSALDSAKQLGSKLFNPLEDAGGSTAGDQAVGPSRVVMLPWEAPGLSEGVRSRMRALSQERSIFLAPPAGGHASFRFDLASSLPLVLEALSIDRRLEEQRHLLVPSQVAEETFFTNYFHHLDVIAKGGGGGGGCGGGGGGSSELRSGAQSPSSAASSAVLVSEALSESSDVTGTEADPNGTDLPNLGGLVPSTPLASLATGAAPGTTPLSRASLERRGLRAPSGASLSIEEQFECVSAMLTPTKPSRGPTGTGAGAGIGIAAGAVTPFTAAVAGTATPAAASFPTAAGGAGASTPTGIASPFTAATTTPAARAAAALPSVPPAPPATTPAVGKGAPSLLSDWEAEMQAELGH